MEGVAALLGRLLTNIGGPGNKVHYLNTKLIKSMTLYGHRFGHDTSGMMALEFYGEYKARWLLALLVFIAVALHDVAFALPGLTPLRNTADTYPTTNERIRVFRCMGVHIPKTMAAHMRS